MARNAVLKHIRSSATFAGVLAFGAVLSGCSLGRSAASPQALACERVGSSSAASVFAGSKGHPIEVVTTTRHMGKVVTRPVIGAASFVVAEPGVTKAFLERVAICEAAGLTAKSGVEHSASVEYATGGYRVAITTNNRDAAKALYNYAKAAQDAKPVTTAAEDGSGIAL